MKLKRGLVSAAEAHQDSPTIHFISLLFNLNLFFTLRLCERHAHRNQAKLSVGNFTLVDFIWLSIKYAFVLVYLSRCVLYILFLIIFHRWVDSGIHYTICSFDENRISKTKETWKKLWIFIFRGCFTSDSLFEFQSIGEQHNYKKGCVTILLAAHDVNHSMKFK